MSNSETLAPYEDEEEAVVEIEEDESDGETPAAPVPVAGKIRPKLKTKGKKYQPGSPGLRVGRKSALTDEFWVELKTLYEGSGYSQRDIVNYAKSRGIVISQPAIARRALDQGWVKGARRAEIREAMVDEMRSAVGEGFRKMLEQHTNQAMTAEMEILRHFQNANERRKTDPSYDIPATHLVQLTSAMKMAHELRGRSMGFNYREGRPFKIESDDDTSLSTFTVRVMGDDEHDELKRKGEEQNEEES